MTKEEAATADQEAKETKPAESKADETYVYMYLYTCLNESRRKGGGKVPDPG